MNQSTSLVQDPIIDDTRLKRRFDQLQQESRGGLITFITAGDPSAEVSFQLMQRLPAAGADVIELGMPFSDPMADGPAVQAASLRALKAGMTLPSTLDMVCRFRQDDNETPIILMGYYNPIYRYGPSRFIADAKAAGVDGLIIVDLPAEEDDELCQPAIAAGIHWIRLITPTTTDRRLSQLLPLASGFLYYVSITGITGTRSATQAQIDQAVLRLRRHSALPIAVGFGIKTPADAAAVVSSADAAVVGSALIQQIAEMLDENATPKPGLVDCVLNQVSKLAAASKTSST